MSTSITAYRSITDYVEGQVIPEGSGWTHADSDDREYIVSPNSPFGVDQVSYRGSSLARYQDALREAFGDAFELLPLGGDHVLTHDKVLAVQAVYRAHPLLPGKGVYARDVDHMHSAIARIVRAAAAEPLGGVTVC